jgi:CheY-like chemotaxis protein/signal transduction histidine kinase/HPt (histidine-containing phosphotransfer) domain-containing protein
MQKEFSQSPSLILRVRSIFLGVTGFFYLFSVLGIVLSAYLTIGTSAEQASTYLTIAVIGLLYTVAFGVAVWFSLKRMQQVLHPLARLEGPLQRIAKGDFETALHDGDVDKEIEIIHRALRTTIIALKEREKKRNASVPAIAEMAHANQQHKETLIHNLSHEIHTPMNGIIGMLDLLRDTDLSRTQREFVNMAHASADNLLRRLNDMLDVSRLDSGKLALEHVAFDLSKEVDASFNANLATAKHDGIELISHTAIPNLQHLIGNPVRIRQVMSNLVRHAIKLSKQGQVVFDVTATKQEGTCIIGMSVTGNKIELNGRPLADLLAPTSDDIHLQINNQEISLPACKKIANLLGGNIEVEDKGDHTITLLFSLEMQFAPAADSVLLDDPTRNVRILFVSPGQATYLSHKEQLANAGMRADSVQSTVNALNAIEVAVASQAPYRIVVLDYQLPDIDGEIFGSAIKSDPKFCDTQLVLIDPPDMNNHQRFIGAGFSACLETPLPPHALMDVLQVLCVAVKSGATAPFLTPSTLTTPSAPIAESQIFSNYRILIADDNIVNQQVALHILEKLGVRADIAKDGQEAINLHALQPYDLILMDCQMPVMDGYQATKAIRAKEAGPRIPIIALTAFTMQGEREQCFAAGMDDFIAKPIRLSIMREALGRWLRPSAHQQPEIRDDFASMQKMFGADFEALTQLYLSDSPKRITSLTEAIAEKNPARVASVAHSLSGSCASIGATAMSALCKELEIQSKADQLDNAEEMLAEIGMEYARVSTKLQSMIQTT